MISKRLLKTGIIRVVNRMSSITIIKGILLNRRKKIVKQNINEATILIQSANKVYINLPQKPLVGIATYEDESITDPIRDYLLRYYNFLEYNQIPYKKIIINQSDWIEQVNTCDILIWWISSKPFRLLEARTKIYFLENRTNTLCYPCFDEAYLYEDKERLYYFCKMNNLPIVNTFISHNEEEVYYFINSAKYPIVSKINTGSGARGVQLLKNRSSALKYARKVFGSGKSTYHTYLKQKNFVYFQEYLHDCQYDLRIIVIEEKIFGYYRMKPKSDFRASGGGIYVKKELPEEAMRLAIRTSRLLKTHILAVDMIKSEAKGIFEIIEASIFFGVETCQQLIINGKPGYYHYSNEDFTFHEGKYWIQDLVLANILKGWDYERNSSKSEYKQDK